MKFALALVLLVGILSARSSVASDTTSLLLGNTTYSFQVCDPTAALSPYNGFPHYFHFYFYGPIGTSYQATVNGTQMSANPFNRYDTPNLPAGTTCSGTITMTTSGVAVGAKYTGILQGDVVDIESCYIEGGQQTCPQDTDWFVYFVNPATPGVSLSPNTTITATGSYPITVTLPDTTSSVSYANQTVTAACTTQFGAQVSVSPSSQTTDITGKALFTINATQLAVPVPGGTPSATCTFTAATGGRTASIQATGSIVQPLVSVNPSSIAVNGTTSVNATISPVYSGVQIDASCTTSLASVTYPASAVTNAAGVAAFSLTANGLVTTNPNTTIKPSASCTFSVHNGNGKSTLTYTTYNACALPLVPLPGACGGPP